MSSSSVQKIHAHNVQKYNNSRKCHVCLKINCREKNFFFFIFFTIKNIHSKLVKCEFSDKRKLDRCIFKDVSK